MSELETTQDYTYDDYCKLDDGKRYELIDGIIYAMSPAPILRHQIIIGNLFAEFHNYLKGKSCRVFVAPVDVRLNADDKNNTVVQPDLVIVCDKSKIDNKKSCKGAPDLVVEVLSPSTAKMDRLIKLKLYQEAGVKEYWIVDLDINVVHVLTLKDGAYITSVYGEKDTIAVGILEDCKINLKEIFEEI